MALSPKILEWETAVLRPALQEIVASEELQRDYYPMLLDEPYYDAAESVDELIQTLVKSLRRTGGSTLWIANNTPPPGLPLVAGTYVMTVFYREEDRIYANPGVIMWMRFNNKLHAFDHRYDPSIANHAIEDITRKHVLDHILASFSFYKLNAFADQPFPGYR